MTTETPFKTSIAENIFYNKYAQGRNDTWRNLAVRVVDDVCGKMGGGARQNLLSNDDLKDLTKFITEMKFIPGGRYLYYAGRPLHAWNNCYLLGGEDDTREEWGSLLKRGSDCLMTGGGIGSDYSVFRPEGAALRRTGGRSSGPLPLMHSMNEVGRNVMQGGSRRSAIYASLNWLHDDAPRFLKMKNWANMPIGNAKNNDGTPYTVWNAKQENFNYHAPLDMTNVSLNYDDAWLDNENRASSETFLANVRQAMETGEPGFSFNFREKQKETLRNACWSYESKLLTDSGYYSIGDLCGKEVKIWNGEQWSAVVPFSTGINRLVRVHLSDGSYADVTSYHKFLVIEGFNNTDHSRVAAKDLQEGDKLQKWAMPTVSSAGNADPLQHVRVLYVEDTDRVEETFCVTEPLLNQMTVGGIVTGNCCEVTSEDDSDVCNLGSVNMGSIQSLDEFKRVIELASKFLVCGTIRADLPYKKVYEVRDKNRRLGLGLMGMHEWLIRRGHKYEVGDELHRWLAVYRDESTRAAYEHCDRFFLSRPVACRSIAPTGTIGMLASTTTGIEPLFAVAYKRRYLKDGTRWHYEYVIDATADHMIKELGANPADIDTAYKMSESFERRIKFQADVQDYVDMAISSTINLPPWGSKLNNEDRVSDFAAILSQYAPRLRGFTAYPDGSRGGQPLVEVEYDTAVQHKGVVYEEHSSCAGGVCGV